MEPFTEPGHSVVGERCDEKRRKTGTEACLIAMRSVAGRTRGFTAPGHEVGE